jgi:hypothetical protein
MEGFDIRGAEPSTSAKRVNYVKFFDKANICFPKFYNNSGIAEQCFMQALRYNTAYVRTNMIQY